MKPSTSRLVTPRFVASGFLLLAIATGCSTPAPQPSGKLEAMAAEAACRKLAADLFTAIPPDRFALPGAKASKKSVTIAPMFDLKTSDQNSAMQACDAFIGNQAALPQSPFDVQPFGGDELAKSTYAIVVASELMDATTGQNNVRMRAVLVETKTGKIAGRSDAIARLDGVSASSTPFFRDSPVIVRDEFLESHNATLRMTAGETASPRFLQDLRVRAELARPIGLYNRERYPEALKDFKSVAASQHGDTLTSQVGIYVSGAQVGAEQDVAQASESIVDKGFNSRLLEFKIFFRPDSVTPYSKPPFDTMRLVPPAARRVAGGNLCLTIVGHTSKSGSAAYNKALSLKRAEFIKEQMVKANPTVRLKILADGKGFDENMVGNGRDDDSDVADRRVEFRARNC